MNNRALIAEKICGQLAPVGFGYKLKPPRFIRPLNYSVAAQERSAWTYDDLYIFFDSLNTLYKK